MGTPLKTSLTARWSPGQDDQNREVDGWNSNNGDDNESCGGGAVTEATKFFSIRTWALDTLLNILKIGLRLISLV